MNKKTLRLIALVLALILFGSVLITVITYASASAAPTMDEIDALKEEQAALEEQQAELNAEIAALETESASATAKKAVLDEQVELTQQEIDNITQRIAIYDQLIVEEEDRLEQAQQNEDEQWERYKERIRLMEENGATSYLSIILDATSFVDLLARIDVVRSVMEEDEHQYQLYVAAREAKEEAMASLENVRSQQAGERIILEKKQNQLVTQVDEASAYIASLEDSIETYQAYVDEVNAHYAELDEQIAQMTKEYEEEQERLRKEREAAAAAAAANQSGGGSSSGSSSYVSGTGSFVWPATSWLITSPYGTRLHPIYGVYRTHNGVDIGASYGTPIYAADSGTVTISQYDSSYGNYIYINHGNGYCTLYAHMSQRVASVGDYVSQGEVIGYVGSTGDSTGPHLHFEIRYNGSRQDPLDYFSGWVRYW